MTERKWDFSEAWKWGVIEQGPLILSIADVAEIAKKTKLPWALENDQVLIVLNVVAWRGFAIAISSDPARVDHQQAFERLLKKFENDCACLPWPFPDLAAKAAHTARHDELFKVAAPKITVGGNDMWRQLELLRCILGAYEAVTGRKTAETKNGPTARFLDAICDHMIAFCDKVGNLSEQRAIWVKVRGSDKESWKIGFIDTTDILGNVTKAERDEVRKKELAQARLAITNQRDAMIAKTYR